MRTRTLAVCTVFSLFLAGGAGLAEDGKPSTTSATVPPGAPASEWVTPVEFGAVGDGEADDTVAIQRALDAAVAQRKDVYLPDGVYRVTEPIRIPATWSSTTGGHRYFILRGNGGMLKAGKEMSYVLTTAKTYWIILEGIVVDANRLAEHAVVLDHIGGARSAVRHLEAMNATSHGVVLRECQILTIANSVSCGNGGDGFRFEGCNAAVATTLTANGSRGNGITITGRPRYSGGMTVNTSDIEGNHGHGIHVVGTASPVVINGGWLEGNRRDGVRIEARSVVVQRVGITGLSTGNSWAIHLLKAARGCVVQHNYVQAGGGDGTYASVRLDEGTQGNVVTDNFQRYAGGAATVLTGPPAFAPDTVFAPVGPNLLKHGDCESPDGWRQRYSKPLAKGRSTERAKEGESSWRIATDYDGGAVEPVRLIPHKRYRLTGWIYVEKGRADLAVKNGKALIYGLCVSGKAEWVRKALEFTAVGEQGYVVMKGAGGDTVAYYDEIPLVELAPREPAPDR